MGIAAPKVKVQEGWLVSSDSSLAIVSSFPLRS
jgi:hypothetical protein